MEEGYADEDREGEFWANDSYGDDEERRAGGGGFYSEF